MKVLAVLQVVVLDSDVSVESLSDVYLTSL